MMVFMSLLLLFSPCTQKKEPVFSGQVVSSWIVYVKQASGMLSAGAVDTEASRALLLRDTATAHALPGAATGLLPPIRSLSLSCTFHWLRELHSFDQVVSRVKEQLACQPQQIASFAAALMEAVQRLLDVVDVWMLARPPMADSAVPANEEQIEEAALRLITTQCVPVLCHFILSALSPECVSPWRLCAQRWVSVGNVLFGHDCSDAISSGGSLLPLRPARREAQSQWVRQLQECGETVLKALVTTQITTFATTGSLSTDRVMLASILSLPPTIDPRDGLAAPLVLAEVDAFCTSWLELVVIPSLHHNTWRAHSRFFGGRSVSHAITYGLSVVRSTAAELCNSPQVCLLPVALQLVQRLVCHLTGALARAMSQLQTSEARLHQLHGDMLYLVRGVREMRLLLSNPSHSTPPSSEVPLESLHVELPRFVAACNPTDLALVQLLTAVSLRCCSLAELERCMASLCAADEDVYSALRSCVVEATNGFEEFLSKIWSPAPFFPQSFTTGSIAALDAETLPFAQLSSIYLPPPFLTVKELLQPDGYTGPVLSMPLAVLLLMKPGSPREWDVSGLTDIVGGIAGKGAHVLYRHLMVSYVSLRWELNDDYPALEEDTIRESKRRLSEALLPLQGASGGPR